RSRRHHSPDLREELRSHYEIFSQLFQVRRGLTVCATKRLPVMKASTVDRSERCIGMTSREISHTIDRSPANLDAVPINVAYPVGTAEHDRDWSARRLL